MTENKITKYFSFDPSKEKSLEQLRNDQDKLPPHIRRKNLLKKRVNTSARKILSKRTKISSPVLLNNNQTDCCQAKVSELLYQLIYNKL